MPVNWKFNFSQLKDLDNDFKASEKAIPVIVQKVLREQLGGLRSQLRSLIPRKTGRLQRAFGYSVRKRTGLVTGRIGFLINRRVSASTSIAASVLQAGGATPRKGKYLWIPLPGNRNADGSAIISPRQLDGFVATSRAGNRIAFRRVGDQAIPMFLLKDFIRLSRPPVPIDQSVESHLPEITGDIEQTIAQIIEARKAVIGEISK